MNDSSISLAVFTFLIGLGAAYAAASLLFARRLAVEVDKGVKNIEVARAAFDQKLEQIRSELASQFERTLGQERATFQSQIEMARSEHAAAMREAAQRFEKQLDAKTENDLSVTLYPTVTHERKKGYFNEETRVEIGHRYQLFIRGIPCFAPHDVIVETTIEKKFDDEKLALVRDKALVLAEAMLNTNAGGIASKVISVAKTIVKQVK